MDDKLRIISLGAGVQSTAMLLMAQEGMWGDIPQHAIFSDTGNEPAQVYGWLEQLIKISKIPITIVRAGDIAVDLVDWINGKNKRGASIPGFTMSATGERGMLPRQCTKDYKIIPIQRECRKIMKSMGLKEVEQWIGISWDEIIRMKESRVGYIKSRWPLVEKHITREGCIKWLAKQGIAEPPKSSCIICPFHSDKHWRDMQLKDPLSFERAVATDRIYRRLPALRDNAFLHKSCRPLSEVDFRTDVELGQLEFGGECEGMCGV